MKFMSAGAEGDQLFLVVEESLAVSFLLELLLEAGQGVEFSGIELIEQAGGGAINSLDLEKGSSSGFGGLGIVEGEIGQFVARIRRQEFVKITGKGAEIGLEAKSLGARGGGELQDLTIGFLLEPGVEPGAIFGRKMCEFIVSTQYHALKVVFRF